MSSSFTTTMPAAAAATAASSSDPDPEGGCSAVTTLDIIIIGAGLSGINAARRVKTELPHRSFAVLEGRGRIGGTWDFWKYPGARTDSSMTAFGFSWYPWRRQANMAPAADLRDYMEEAAAFAGVDSEIRFRHRVKAISWSSEEQMWTLQVDVSPSSSSSFSSSEVTRKIFKTWFLVGASGYYSYDKPLPAVIPGIDNFRGDVVHPQFWDDKTADHAGKRVVIIGSGATAITLLPELAKTAAKVTMLQRSPSYVMPLPGKVPIFFWSRLLPVGWSDWLTWWFRVLFEVAFTSFLTGFPSLANRLVRAEMRHYLPRGTDMMEKHFTPRYDVLQQRLCFCPDADFFKALRRPNTEVVTDVIETVTATGISLKSGGTLEADMIITATGLYMSLLDGVSITVDGARVDGTLGQRYIWNGVMIDGVPNAGVLTGYIATTWTPGADIRMKQLIKVIRHLEKTGATSVTPALEEGQRERFPKTSAMPLTSTYAVAARERIPMSAFVGPWRSGMHWVSDAWNYVFGTITAGARYTYPDGGKRKPQ